MPDPKRATRRRLRALLLSAFVWPGAGQLTTGRRAIGLALAGASLVIGLAIAGMIASLVMAGMPDDPTAALDVALVAERVHATLAHVGGQLALLVGLLAVVWLYAIADAWLGTGAE